MIGNCTLVLTKGKNKGKMCGEISRYCRHQILECEYCHRVYTRDNTYSNHLRACRERSSKTVPAGPPTAPAPASTEPPVLPNHPVPDHVPDPVPVPDSPPSLPAAKIKPKVTKLSLETTLSKIVDSKMAEINSKLDDLQRTIAEKQDVTINQFNINLNVHLGDNFYQELVDKMGRDAALQFIIAAAGKRSPLDIVKKLYLDGLPAGHFPPIACRNGDHFRFLTADRKVVDDIGGRDITARVSNGIQNAMLLASNDLIARQVTRETEMTDEDMDVFMLVQNYATSTPNNKEIKDGLVTMTTDLCHPFW